MASFAEVWERTWKCPVGVITAFHHGCSTAENCARNLKLAGMIRDAGFVHFRLNGYYADAEKAKTYSASVAFLVLGAEGPDKGPDRGQQRGLRALLIRAGAEFLQDVVLYKDATSPQAFLLYPPFLLYPLSSGKAELMGVWDLSCIVRFHQIGVSAPFVLESIEDARGVVLPVSAGGDCAADITGPGDVPLRDWLAGQAIVGAAQGRLDPSEPKESFRRLAHVAYKIADAMLEARQGR